MYFLGKFSVSVTMEKFGTIKKRGLMNKRKQITEFLVERGGSQDADGFSWTGREHLSLSP